MTFNAGASAYSFTNSQNLNFDGAGIVVNGGSATVINDYWLIFTNASSAGSATMINNSYQYFVDTSTAGSATITNSGNLSFYVGSTAGSAAITNTTGYLMFETGSTAGNAVITNGNVMTVRGTAGSATIINNYSLSFITSGSAGNANITNNGTLDFSGFYNPTAGSATITNNSGSITYFGDTSSGGSARLIANAGGVFDFSSLTSAGTTAGSFEGAGRFELGAKTLTVGGNGLSSTVSGVIADGGTGGALVKTGTGSLTLSGTNTYTGGTTITGGGLYLGDSVGTGKILNAVAVGASGTFEVINADTSGITSITNDGYTNFRNNTSAGSVAITNNYGGNTGFYGTSTAGSATITNNWNLGFRTNATCRQRYHHQLSNPEFLQHQHGRKRRDHQQRHLVFQRRQHGRQRYHHQQQLCGFLRHQHGRQLNVITNSGGTTYFDDTSSGGNARLIANAGDAFDFSRLTSTGTIAGSFEGAGTFSLGSNELTVGGNDLSTTVSGVIADGGSTAAPAARWSRPAPAR